MRRDFTYIDDAVAGVLAALGGQAGGGAKRCSHKIYNIGNHHPEELRATTPA